MRSFFQILKEIVHFETSSVDLQGVTTMCKGVVAMQCGGSPHKDLCEQQLF